MVYYIKKASVYNKEGTCMKKKKWLIIALSTLVIIPVSFAITDKIRYNNGERAIFVSDLGSGGEVDIYKGFGYKILYFYPQTSTEDELERIYSEWRWFWED